MDSPFVAPEDMNATQLMFMTVVYGVILYQSSQLIAGGSELLLLIPAVAGIVGSIVLPILGAVPDGVMVLFSGLGPDAQNQVSVGVGALAGSTVMLLTFPWFIAIIYGHVPLDKDGNAQYGKHEEQQGGEEKGGGMLSGGITYQESLQKAAKIMLGTTLLFLVIQLPASYEEGVTSKTRVQAMFENFWSLAGLFLCVAAFVAYLVYCFQDANEDKQLAKVIDGIKKREISIGAAMKWAKATSSGDMEAELLPKEEERLRKIIRPFFALLDADSSGALDLSEFKNLLHELGEKPKPKAVQMFQEKDLNQDNSLCFDEVSKFLYTYLAKENIDKLKDKANPRYLPKYDCEGEEEEEMPEDIADLPPDRQRRCILFRACWQMGLGTLMVLIFSDPMVDVLSDWGRRLSISPFYISFVLAPFASNASELLSAYTYAAKKSQKSITTALSTLIGAACMNNTFCLAIFLALVYFKSLAWQFTAETLAIVLIQWVIGGLTIMRKTQTTPMAFLILACYPGCLFIVWFFENVMLWD